MRFASVFIELSTIFRNKYDRIEVEFLQAKMELYQSLERKELLAEHLSTIISHNEERKAARLRQLMEKVGIAADEQPPTAWFRLNGNDLMFNKRDLAFIKYIGLVTRLF